jgi:hypothetical protein
VNPSHHLRTEADPVSETVCSLILRIPDDGQSPDASDSLTTILSIEAHNGNLRRVWRLMTSATDVTLAYTTESNRNLGTISGFQY